MPSGRVPRVRRGGALAIGPRPSPARQRTALVVILSLIFGLVGATGVIPQEPAAAAVSVAQASYWRFDETSGTTAADSVGTKPATLNSGASNTPGLRGPSSVAVNGTTGAAATSGAVLNTSASFSVSAYVKLNTLTGFQTAVSQDGTNVSGFFLQLRGDTGRFAFSRESADAINALTTYAGATAAPVVGQWYHLTGVYNATAKTLALYVNGRLQATTATTSSFNTTGNFAMGRARYNAQSVDFLNGTIDEVRAYRGAVTADDVEQIADSAWYQLDEGSGTTATDAGLTGIDGSLVNGPTYTPGPIGSSLSFDGTDDHINATRQTFDSTKSFSVTAWARASQFSSSRVVASADGSNYSTFLLATTTTGRWAFSRASADVASPTPTTIASTATATAGTWYHLAGVYDSVARTLTFYVDGVKQGASVSYTTGWRASGNLIVGRGLVAGSPAAYFSGGIDEVHTYPFAINDGMAAQLAAPTPPPTPATPTATSATSTSVALSWVAPNPISGSPTTGYVVTPYVNGVAQAPQTFNTTATTQTFTGLTAGSSYRYTVAAINTNGTSSPSAQSAAVSPAATVPGAPTAVTAAAGSQSATVSWTAPSSNGGSAITGYVVTPFIGTTAQTSQTFASTATSQRVTGLTAGTAYTFRVAARNAAGTGALSAASAAVTPNALPTLTFADPPPGSVGVAYSTQLTATGGTSPFVWSVSSGTLPAGLTLSSTGLLSGTPTATGSSTVTVRAVDASGESATKAVTLVITGAPAAPARPTAIAGLAEATVSWVAPSSNGATITSYVITPFLTGVAQTPVTVDAAATTRVLGGLTPGGSYTFTVAAVNARGTSSPSAVSLAVVPYAALNAPAITSVRAGTSSAVLTWTAPSSDGGSAITGYLVTPYIGAVAQPTQTFTGTATTRTVTGLTPGTPYTFRVAAQNASGTTSLFRVNAGGPLVAAPDGGPSWSADNTTDSPYRNNSSGTTSTSTAAALDSTIPAGTPVTLFNSDRYDFPGNEDMLWRFPVTAGASVKVRLYFANRYVPTGQVGNRVFDVALDGTQVLSSFDMVAGAGGDQTGTMREFAITSDGVVDISFGAKVENPQVNAIEIIQTGVAATGPASAASATTTPNASPTLNFAAPPAGQVGLTYSTQLVVTGGTSPFVWSLSAGSLPGGLTLNASTGLLSGTPTTAGTFSSTVQVTDASGETATKVVTLAITAAPAISFTPAAGEVSLAYSQQPTLTGGTAPFSWRISAGSLPAGLTVNAATGLVSGTPTAAGTASFTLTVTDGLGATASRTTSIVIAALPTLTFTPPPAGQVAVAYSTTLTAAGGTAPLVWSISAGSPPSGLSLNTSTGVLSGTPTTVGSSSFTVTVRDAFDQTTSKAVTLVITAGPLVIAKTANASTAVAGDVVRYTTTLTNTGTTAFTGVNLSDPLGSPGSVLDDATYRADAAASSGAVSYAGSTVSWTGDVPAGGVVTITYSVTVNNPGTGNKVLASTVTSSTLGTNCASGSTDTRCTATVTVAGLSIVKTATPTSTTPGGVVRFTIVATNSGGGPLAGATLTDQLAGVLDDATYNADGSASAGQLSFANPSLTWTGNLAVGASVTITYSVTVNNPDLGDRSLTAAVVSSTPGSTCPSSAPASSCTTTVAVLVPGLGITNAANSSSTTPGSLVTYTQTLSNNGQTAYTGTTVSVALSGALDDATYVSVTASSGSVVFDAGTGTAVWTGDLALGAAVTVTETLSVRNPAVGDRAMTATVTSAAAGSSCPTGTSSAPCTATVQVLVPALTIRQTTDVASTTPSGVVRYTVTLTNTGQTPYTGAAFRTSLAGALDDATYNADVTASSGTVSYSAPDLSWTGNLAIAATATITYSVTVLNPDLGDRSLTGTVVSDTPFTNCPPTSSDLRCRSSVPVLLPGLTLSTTADPATTTPGGVVRYTVTVTNTGQTTHSGVTVNLGFAGVFEHATNNNDTVTSSGTLVAKADGSIDWLLTLAPGTAATGSTSFTVLDPVPLDAVLVSTVASDAPGSSCPSGSVTAACTTSVPVLTPSLTITKTADASSVVTGGTVAYTILVTNGGQTTYPAASFDDSLATVLTDATYAGDASATTGALTYAGSTLSWTGSLAPGSTATISYTVVVKDPDPGDKRMTNTVVSSAARNNCAAGSTDPRCTAVVDVLVPGLTIVKKADVATTVPGATVGYTVVITNSGTTDYTGATFSDPLGAVLDDANYAGGAAATSGTVALSNQTLSWTGDLVVGASATITYAVTVRAAAAGDNLLRGTVTSSSRGSNCAVSSVDPRCTVVVPVARLDLYQYAAEPTTTPGSVVRVTAVYTNTGQVPYTGISVSSPRADTGDDTVPTGDQSASSGVLTRTDTALIWTGSIPVGGTVTITRTLTVKNPDTGNQVIRATVSSDAPGSNCPAGTTDPRCTFSVTVLTPALSITKTASTTAVAPGATVGFTITITNTGQTDYTGALVTDALAGALDDGALTGDAGATSGTLSSSGSTLTWTGDLAVGATSVVTYSVVANSPAAGDKTMVNQVSSTDVGSNCPPASGRAGCRVTVLVLTPALTVVTTADELNATLGATVTYTVRVTNSGQTSYAAAAVSTSLAAVLDDATYQPESLAATRGTVSYSAAVISWSGALNPSDSATITYRVTINNPSTGDRTMTSAATSSDAGSNCTAGSTDTRCTAVVAITNAVTLTFTSTTGVRSAVAGQVVVHTVTVQNSSGVPVVAASFTDDLTGLLDDAAYNGDVQASGGSASFAGSAMSWTGDVAAGATVTVTFSVTVRAATATGGDQILTNRVSSASVPESNNCLAASTDPRCASTVTVASLLLQQSYTESTTTPGSVLHLTATFTNTGTTPYNGITVTSPSADTVDDAIPTGDQTASSGTLVLSATAITWTGNIAVGQTITIVGTLTVKNPDLTANRRVTGTLVSDAPGNNCAAGSGDSRCTALSVVLVPGLTITKAANATFTTPGGTVGYTITVRNSGETAYTAATVVDTLTGVLDDASYNPTAVASTGSLSYSAPTLTWTGALAVDATATITYSVTAATPGTGDKSMVNTVSSDAVGSTCLPGTSNPSCANSVDVRTPALTTTVAASKTSALPGDVVAYTLTTSNTGQTDYAAATFSTDLADLLDDAAFSGAASASTGAVVRNGSSLDWVGALPIGSQVTVTFSVTVNNPVVGNHRLAQVVTSTAPGSNCAAGGTDPRCSTSVPIASLQIVNSVDVVTTQPTKVVRHTGTFTNTGQVPYVGITVYDSFVGTLDNATYNGDAAATSGSVVIVVGSGRIVWTGDIAVGQTVTITGSVTVNNPATGDDILTTRITTDAPASNCPADGTDARCATAVTLLRPALVLTKAVSATTTTPGATIGYTITATNTGEAPYVGAVIRDDLTSALANATISGLASTSGTVSNNNRVLAWTGDLAIGQTVTITYALRTNDPDLGGGLIGNTVTSDEVGSTCPTGSSSAACTTLVTILRPALDVSVAADRTSTTPGSDVGYTIVVRNAGETVYTGASVTAALADVLDDAVLAGAAVVTGPGTAVSSESALTWTGDLAIGETATIAYRVTVADPDTGDRSLVTSVSSPAQGTTCSAADPCLNTVQVLLPGLDVTTSADQATATPGAPVTFTIRIRNTGETSYVDTSVSTDLAGVVDDATFDGAISSSSGTTSYTGTQLTWAGTLAPLDEVLIRYTVVVRPAAALADQDKVLTTTVLAEAPGSTCRTGISSPSCTASVSVLIPGLSITKSASTPTTTPGSLVLYTIRITNSGQTAYTDAVVTDSLSGVLGEASYNADATVTGGGTVVYADSTLTWTGDLLVGATATITYFLRVNTPYVGDRSLSNSVVSSAPGSTCPAGALQPGCTSVVQVLIPALAVTQTADRTSVVAGSSVTYTVTLTNTGETDHQPATFTDSLAAPGVLAFADYAGDADATTGTVSYTNETLVWTGALLKGQTAVVTFSVVTRYPAPAPVDGVRLMTNRVTSATPGSTCVTGGRAQCRTAVTVLQPALSIVKTADTSEVVAGGTVGYTITATNTGEADYSSATLSDDLSGLLANGTFGGDATASTGVVGYDGGVVSWSGSLVRGASVSISFSVAISVDAPDTVVLTNRVVSSTVGSTCLAGSASPSCVTTTSIAARTITLSDLTPSFTLTGLPGSTVEQDGAVAMTVTTNSPGGYAVTVESTTDALLATAPGNSDTIPIEQLRVRESGSSLFTPLSRTPLTIHTSRGPSAPGGDAVSNDYQVTIPYVASDTYSTTLEYIVTAR